MKNKLTKLAIDTLEPKQKDYRVSDGQGLYLVVTATNKKRWLFRYKFSKLVKGVTKTVENSLSFGSYPNITLKQARQKRDEARSLLERNIDPAEKRKADKANSSYNSAKSFEAIAREWFNTKIKGGDFTTSHVKKIMTRFEKDVFPYIGKLEIKKIKAIDLLNLARGYA